MIHIFTFAVTAMKHQETYQVLLYYCGRGKIENLINERWSGFVFSHFSTLLKYHFYAARKLPRFFRAISASF